MSDPMKGASTISELADRYGVSQRTLRFYEQQGLLRPLIRSDRSFYSKDDELRLQVILKGPSARVLPRRNCFANPNMYRAATGDLIDSIDVALVASMKLVCR